MPYIDTNTRTNSPISGGRQQPLGRAPLLSGVYVGFVKDVTDVQRNGRLRVWIPELGAAPNEESGWMVVSYCSPFAGATNVNTTSKSNIQDFDGTQTSYGMWMIPPDINNQVLVMFANGDAARGFWIGCLYNQFMNNMVPGMAADENNYQYQGKIIPVAEYNKWDTKITQPDKATKPYEKTKFKGLGNQGLITDQGRGITTSSARRESPSTVFGILTPGPVIDSAASPANIRRKGGSSFIMDDETGSEYVQLTTKSGAQVKLDETNGFVYLINRDGTAWVQMDQKGNIDIFGATNISMRAQKDINLRADRNINIEAGQNIYMKAAKDTTTSTTTFTYDINNVPNTQTIPLYKYVGEGAGEGGNIVVQALNNMHTTVHKDSFQTVKNNSNIDVLKDFFITVGKDNIVLIENNYALTTSGKQDYKSAGDIHIQTDAEYNLKTGTKVLVNAGTSINLKADTNILSQAKFFDITAKSRITGGVEINSTLKVTAGSFLGGAVQLGGSVPTDKPISPTDASAASKATKSTPAEIKQKVEKINILATWSDPESKFKRNSESLQTTVSILPTYEPCPEHENFSFKSISGYTPTQTDGAKTYAGSGGAGSEATATPPTDTTPGANNTDIPPTPANESAVSKNFNLDAYQCQLKIHEGVKYVSYLDSIGLPTAGIGHLLRSNEVTKFPVPTVVSKEQVDQWFQQDAPISISGAQRLLGIDTWGELTDIRKRACADLCYNMGEGRLSKFVRFIAAMKAGNYNAAGDSLRQSKWFTQVGRRGPNIITMIVNDVDPNRCDQKFPPA